MFSSIAGVISGLIYATKAVEEPGVDYSRIFLLGGAAKDSEVRQISADIFGRAIDTPSISECVADGTSKQAVWGAEEYPPNWSPAESKRVTPQAQIDGILESYLRLIS